jgi:hypothetical protein
MSQKATNIPTFPLVIKKQRDEKIFNLFGNNL